MECFMVKTGFYNTVTRLEAERRDEWLQLQAEAKAKGESIPLNWPGQEQPTK